MTARIIVTIDELVLDGVEDGAPTAQLVQVEVARALAQQPVQRANEIAAEVGRAVDGSVRP